VSQERPILFKAELVRAIMMGFKCETRRVLKEVFLPDPARFVPYKEWSWAPESNSGKMFIDNTWRPVSCPYGRPGDRLWVKEAFSIRKPEDYAQKNPGAVYYASNYPHSKDRKWRPSLFMPRWASRLTLKIDAVSVERLYDITEEGARREGVRDRAEFEVL
jgi:hypothetical protein